MGEWVTEYAPTCVAEGLEKSTCSVCFYEGTNTLPATGHEFGEWHVVSQPTCCDLGLEERECSLCSVVESKDIPLVDHALGEWIEVLQATCEDEGTEERACANCSYFESRSVDPTGHFLSYWYVSIEADCYNDGLLLQECLNCGLVNQDTIPCLGHSFNDWIIDLDATTEFEGYKHRECEACGFREQEIIPIVVPPSGDSPEDAILLNSLGAPLSTNGEQGKELWFVFEVTIPGIYVIQTRSVYGDPRGMLFDMDLGILSDSDDVLGRDYMIIIDLEIGTYYLSNYHYQESVYELIVIHCGSIREVQLNSQVNIEGSGATILELSSNDYLILALGALIEGLSIDTTIYVCVLDSMGNLLSFGEIGTPDDTVSYIAAPGYIFQIYIEVVGKPIDYFDLEIGVELYLEQLSTEEPAVIHTNQVNYFYFIAEEDGAHAIYSDNSKTSGYNISLGAFTIIGDQLGEGEINYLDGDRIILDLFRGDLVIFVAYNDSKNNSNDFHLFIEKIDVNYAGNNIESASELGENLESELFLSSMWDNYLKIEANTAGLYIVTLEGILSMNEHNVIDEFFNYYESSYKSFSNTNYLGVYLEPGTYYVLISLVSSGFVKVNYAVESVSLGGETVESSLEISLGSTDGLYGEHDATNWFKFDVSVHGLYQIRSRSLFGDPSCILLFDKDELQYGDDEIGLDFAIIRQLNPGTYYLQVYFYSSAYYSIEIELIENLDVLEVDTPVVCQSAVPTIFEFIPIATGKYLITGYEKSNISCLLYAEVYLNESRLISGYINNKNSEELIFSGNIGETYVIVIYDFYGGVNEYEVQLTEYIVVQSILVGALEWAGNYLKNDFIFIAPQDGYYRFSAYNTGAYGTHTWLIVSDDYGNYLVEGTIDNDYQEYIFCYLSQGQVVYLHYDFHESDQAFEYEVGIDIIIPTEYTTIGIVQEIIHDYRNFVEFTVTENGEYRIEATNDFASEGVSYGCYIYIDGFLQAFSYLDPINYIPTVFAEVGQKVFLMIYEESGIIGETIELKISLIL